MELIGSYKNGNIHTSIFSDGTKIRETEDDEFIPIFAENMDIKISDYCDMGCPMCHEGSSINGIHADILNQRFIDTLHPYQEVAIGGGDATSHPDLIPFLEKLKVKKVIANMTVNQRHFEQKQELIRQLINNKLIYGLGVSLANPTSQFISLITQYDNAVIHVINGILSPENINALVDKNLKLLILGYKHLRRGNEWYEKDMTNIENRQAWLRDNISSIIKRFKVVSFDNLAIEQLGVRRLMTEAEWNEFYMGDDGTMTYYIDMVNQKFARSSTAPFNRRYDILDSVDDMFKVIVNENK